MEIPRLNETRTLERDAVAQLTPWLASWFTPSAREFIVKSLFGGVFLTVALSVVMSGLTKQGLHPDELQISTTGASLKFVREVKNGVEYIVLVHPNGWQNTHIKVEPNDRIEFNAFGRINLSVYRIGESVRSRHELEQSIDCIVKQRVNVQCDSTRAKRFALSLTSSPTRTPEDDFTPAELASIWPRQPWLGPDGDTAVVDRSYAARTRLKFAPGLTFGRLIGAIAPAGTAGLGSAVPNVLDLGSRKELGPHDRTQAVGGELWLAANDVWYGDGPYGELFTLDNVGFFWVRILITRT